MATFTAVLSSTTMKTPTMIATSGPIMLRIVNGAAPVWAEPAEIVAT